MGENDASHFILDWAFLIWEHILYNKTACDHPLAYPPKIPEGRAPSFWFVNGKQNQNEKDGPTAIGHYIREDRHGLSYVVTGLSRL